MTPHQQETYKSMIALSVEAIKFSALANGGAAVALLTYLGSIHGKANVQPVTGFMLPMVLFALGLLASGLLIATAYLTQLWIFNEAADNPTPTKLSGHRKFLVAAISCFIASLVFFGAGTFAAVGAWSAPAVVAPVGAQ